MTLFKKVGNIRAELTPEEVAEYEANQLSAADKQITNLIAITRDQRNTLLAQSDWTRMDDNGLSISDKESWATYRQALRDLPDQEGFPSEVEFPNAP
jgi:hypothetical protein